MQNPVCLDATISANDMRVASRILTDYCRLVGLNEANPRVADKQAELLMLMRHGVKDVQLLRRVMIDLREF
jgi:hypothetical protein